MKIYLLWEYFDGDKDSKIVGVFANKKKAENLIEDFKDKIAIEKAINRRCKKCPYVYYGKNPNGKHFDKPRCYKSFEDSSEWRCSKSLEICLEADGYYNLGYYIEETELIE